jgi:hypothetical protein
MAAFLVVYDPSKGKEQEMVAALHRWGVTCVFRGAWVNPSPCRAHRQRAQGRRERLPATGPAQCRSQAQACPLVFGRSGSCCRNGMVRMESTQVWNVTIIGRPSPSPTIALLRAAGQRATAAG